MYRTISNALLPSTLVDISRHESAFLGFLIDSRLLQSVQLQTSKVLASHNAYSRAAPSLSTLCWKLFISSSVSDIGSTHITC